MVPIDKAANSVAIICKRYYAEVMLKEIGIIGTGNNTYVRAEKMTEEIIDDNTCYANRLGVEVKIVEKTLLTMYWTPKMHKKLVHLSSSPQSFAPQNPYLMLSLMALN